MTEEASQAYMVCGLGNPGKEYANTRHNLGFMVVELLAKEFAFSLKADRQLNCLIARGKYNGETISLFMPQTFMNESGRAVVQCLNYYKMTTDQLIVVCDDTALKFGQLRIRTKGSSGGHNGLKSIIMHLGTNEFIRLKMGVGNNMAGQSLADYVLSDFNKPETEALNSFVQNGAEAVKLLIKGPLEQAMNKVNIKLNQTEDL